MQIGPYAVAGELGRGGMGVVLRARGPSGPEVAIKLLRTSSPEAKARFDRERRLLLELAATPGLVPILDSGESREGPFLVMPVLTGGSLRERLRRGPLSVQETVRLAERLAGALARAHELGIVHRDVKPENVLFDGEGTPYLSDLGLAKHFASGELATSQNAALSRQGALCGTAGYMAPEQALDARSVGPAADVFALGAVLYECLAGWAAFEGRTLIEVLSKIERESPAPLANARPEAPSWLVRIVDRCLARTVERRFPDGGAVARALERRSEAEGLPAEPRRRGLAVGVAAVAALGVAAALALALRPKDPPAPSPSPSPPAHATPSLAAAQLTAALVQATSPPARRRLLEPFLRRGLVLPVDEARRIVALDPQPEASGLLGVALLAAGQPRDRAEALRLLGAVRSVPEVKAAFDVASSVDAVLAIIDRTLALSFQKDQAAGTVPPELIARFDAVSLQLPKLGAWPAPAVDATLAPLEAPFRRIAIKNELNPVARGWADLAPALERFPRSAPGGWAPRPALLAALDLVGLEVVKVKHEPTYYAEVYGEIARSCSAVDPMLAVVALRRSVLCDFAENGGPPPLAIQREKEAAMVALAAALEVPEERTFAELERARTSRSLWWRAVAECSAEDRARTLDEARRAAEEAYRLSGAAEDGKLGGEAEELIRIYLELGDVSRVDEPMLAACRDRMHRMRSASIAEVTRVRGDAASALAELEHELPDWSDDQAAVAILCELDLGRLEAAEKHWRELDAKTEHGARQVPAVTYFRVQAVGEKVKAAVEKASKK